MKTLDFYLSQLQLHMFCLGGNAIYQKSQWYSHISLSILKKVNDFPNSETL